MLKKEAKMIDGLVTVTELSTALLSSHVLVVMAFSCFSREDLYVPQG